MIDKLKWLGWIAAFSLLILFLLHRSCTKNEPRVPVSVHDTIIVHGDSQLYLVRDSTIKPVKIYIRDTVPNVDTPAILKDYFASRVYLDTIKARDITAVIEDSISDNRIAGHKVLVENKRDTHLITPLPKPKNKVFIGGFLGYSIKDLSPVAGVSVSFITRKDVLYCYNFDVVNRTQTIGLSWKIHL
jgi:hypothetical protein